MNESPQRSWTEPGRDPELALAAQRGDLGALFTLLRKYRRELWRVCFALTLDRQRAERLVHDTLLRAAKNLRSVPTGSSMLPWLVRLAAHLATAAARQAPLGGAGAPSGAGSGAAPLSPEALGTALTQTEQPVLEAFASLSEGERLLLALDTIEHISYADLAVIAKREVPVIMNQVAQIRTRLAREEAA
jgi:RNA polymerase sigma-70 factor (ECF subfamily)